MPKKYSLCKKSSGSSGKFLLTALWGIMAMGAVMLAPNVAYSAYTLCNKTSYTLEAAVATVEQDTGKTVTRGWTRLLSGSCEKVIPHKLSSNHSYYVHAHSLQGYQGHGYYFTGTRKFCVARKATKSFTLEKGEDCVAQNNAQAFFLHVPVTQSDWSTSFSQVEKYTTLLAKNAGIQRLLINNGYGVGVVDGYLGKATHKALEDFTKKNGIKFHGKVTPDIYEALIQGMNSHNHALGLSLCNRTQHVLMSAVGVAKGSTKQTRGWANILPEECIKVIKTPLEAQADYYVYAEAVHFNGSTVRRDGEYLIWKGQSVMCVKPGRFRVTNDALCEQDGGGHVAFIKLAVEGNAGFSYQFTPGFDKQ